MQFGDFAQFCRAWKQQHGPRREVCFDVHLQIRADLVRNRYWMRKYIALRIDAIRLSLESPATGDDSPDVHKRRVEQQIAAYEWLSGVLDEQPCK